MPQLMLTTSSSGVFAVITMPHELDAANAPKVEELTEFVLHSSVPNLIFDLTNLAFMDSSGLNAIVTAYRHAQVSDGTLALVAPQPRVEQILSKTGLKSLMAIYPDLESATALGTVPLDHGHTQTLRDN